MMFLDLAKILADHRLWIAGKGGTRADLADVNLTLDGAA